MSTFWFMAIAVVLYILVSEGINLAIKYKAQKEEKQEALSDLFE